MCTVQFHLTASLTAIVDYRPFLLSPSPSRSRLSPINHRHHTTHTTTFKNSSHCVSIALLLPRTTLLRPSRCESSSSAAVDNILAVFNFSLERCQSQCRCLAPINPFSTTSRAILPNLVPMMRFNSAPTGSTPNSRSSVDLSLPLPLLPSVNLL